MPSLSSSAFQQWFSVPCDWDHLASASIDESDDGQALGAWLLDLPGARTLSISLCGAEQKLKLGFPCAPFSPDSTLPTRAPEPLIDELRTAFGWALHLDTPPPGAEAWRRVLVPRAGVPFVRLGDPVLMHFRSLQADLAERGLPLELRVDLTWDCCSAELAEDARLAMRAAMRRRRPRKEVVQLIRLWMKTVRLRTVIRIHAAADPGRLVEARVVRALSRDLVAPLTTAAQAKACLATPDVLFGLLSLCSLAESKSGEAPADTQADAVRALMAEVPF